MTGRNPIAASYSLKVLLFFLAAALAPLLALSASLTRIAQGALSASLEERGRLAAWAFAERLSELEKRVDASLLSLASNPEIVAALSSPETASSEALHRVLLRESQASGGAVFSAAASGSGLGWSTGEFPPDLNLQRFSTWGVARRVREGGGRTSLFARPRMDSEGRRMCLAAARAVQGLVSGGPPRVETGSSPAPFMGLIVAEIPRELLIATAGSDRDLLSFDAEILGRGGAVAFSLSDPSREGETALFPPFAPPRESGIYEARLGELVLRLYFPKDLAAGLGRAMARATALSLGLAAVAAAFAAVAMARAVTRPVLGLSGAIRRIRSGELGAAAPVASDDEIGQLARSFNEMSAELAALLAAELERAELLRRAELDALAARMNPHFLYNTLNSIKSLAKLGRNPEIVETVSRLAKLLRASASGAGAESTVGAELALVRDYLEIERIRHGERVAVSWDLDPGLEGLPLPRLVLEPLAENAILHGLERSVGPWRLSIRGKIGEGRAEIVFEDDGPGADQTFLESLNFRLLSGSPPEEGGRIGLLATNRRVRLRFGPGSGLRVGPALMPSDSGRPGFRVELGLALPASQGCGLSR